ncbi:pectin methylesterase [Venturia nashicola]|uniref:pectinesterase n=1 Tax=Venturia nashicola TaxID=86259 RepID=A0A4Z1PEY5_9PEZI|nr:pectin methylesterase [Venturia nashicola]
MHFSATVASLFASTVVAITTPPSGALVVGPSGKYKTLQSAVTAASNGATIFIEPGTYKEQVFIPEKKSNLKIIGSSSQDTTFTGNKVTITGALAQDSSGKPNNDGTATLRAWGDGLKVYNVNFANTRGEGSQALALSAYGNQLGFYGCQFTGFQDTVMSHKGHHFIGNSLIVGGTDFIFGKSGVLWIEKSVLHCVKADTGYVTANGREDAANPSFYVINNSTIDGPSAAGTFFLGRPWRPFSRVGVQNSQLGAVINSAGWSVWQKADTRTDKVTYLEYNNRGPGAAGTRATFAKKASSAIPIGTLFPSTSWIDSAYLPKQH